MQRGVLATAQIIDGLLEGVDPAGDVTVIDLLPNKFLGSSTLDKALDASCEFNMFSFLQHPAVVHRCV